MKPILLLSPMQSIADIAPAVIKNMGIEIEIAVSNDEKAEEVVKSYPNIEVVISRGGLAKRIEKIPGISVVTISMSISELMSILNDLTMRGFKKIGIVSRANLFGNTTGQFQILDAQISFHPENNEQAIENKVQQLVSQGVEVIIGCLVAYHCAKKLGVEALFLETSPQSIHAALQEALRILEAKDREKLQAAQLTAIIDNIDEAVIAVAPNNEVSFYNRHAKRLCSHPPFSPPDFSDTLSLFNSGEKELISTINGNNVIAKSIPLEFNSHIRGKVVTLQEVSRIQASESKIRSSFHKKGLFARYHFKDIIGESDPIKELIEKAKAYANHDSNLLIYGETGTGKELLAQSIHNHGKRRKGPFVSVNIASIQPSLLESELFGYVDGAFTGARKGGKPGLFELAHQGTLFLDEIGEMAPEIQNRLLRVLQEREIMRIGDDKIIPIDVRIIFATNKDLYQRTLSGAFRQDLYYRIHVLVLNIPPLRNRGDDIVTIFEHYLTRFSNTEPSIKLTQKAKEYLKSCQWPGNIRQLRNAAEVVAYTHTQNLDHIHLSQIIGEQQSSSTNTNILTIPEKGTLKEMESEIIRSLLTRYSTDEVCSRLGVSRVTLWRKMKNIALSAPT